MKRVAISVVVLALIGTALALGLTLNGSPGPSDMPAGVLCSQAALSVSLGPTQRWSLSEPIKGDIISRTAVDFKNLGPTRRLPREGPALRLAWQPDTVSFPGFSPSLWVRAPEGLTVQNGASETLYLFVRGEAVTEKACHPATVFGIQLAGGNNGMGWRRLLRRTIPDVCSNRALGSESYGVVWAPFWLD